MVTKNWGLRGSSISSVVENTKRRQVKLKVAKTENIIFIGSEMHYDSFWWKMMFIAAAYKMASQRMRTADRVVIAYVDVGYTHLEKLAIDRLQGLYNAEVKKISSASDVVNLMNRARNVYKLRDVFFSTHGIINVIDLNYASYPSVALNQAIFNRVSSTVFSEDGRIFSYACRTGISKQDYPLWRFSSDADAGKENSLAQKLADHFGIEVHAFLRRSHYGEVIRDRTQSTSIASELKTRRKAAEFQQVIALPPQHEALPHPELANSSGPRREGTDNYALWRLHGGRVLPTSADTPTGLSTGISIFKPSA
jgi:hypothetical protein